MVNCASFLVSSCACAYSWVKKAKKQKPRCILRNISKVLRIHGNCTCYFSCGQVREPVRDRSRVKVSVAYVKRSRYIWCWSSAPSWRNISVWIEKNKVVFEVSGNIFKRHDGVARCLSRNISPGIHARCCYYGVVFSFPFLAPSPPPTRASPYSPPEFSRRHILYLQN